MAIGNQTNGVMLTINACFNIYANNVDTIHHFL